MRHYACCLGGPNRRLIYDVTIARHQTLCSHTQYHPHPCLPGICQSINQSSNTNIYSNVFGERIRQYSLCTDTTHHQLITCHACLLSIRSSVNNRLWNFKDRLRNNLSFKSLITPTNKTYLCTIWVNLAIIPKGYYGNNGYDVVGVVVLSECCDEIMQFVIV